MSDRVTSKDTRIEFNAVGAPLAVPHDTSARLSSGLGEVLLIAGAAAAVVGSSGPTSSEHRAPKVGQALVPMPLQCCIRQGCDWFCIDGRAAALKSSIVQVPDALRPFKEGVLETTNDFFFVDGEPVVRGG